MSEHLEPDDALPGDLLALRRLAQVLDRAIAIPGTQRHIGVDALLGLVPGAGDVLGAGISLWIIYGGLRHRVPLRHVSRMVGHIAVDAFVGAIPVLGDVFDVFWEGNTRNVALLLRHRDRTRPPRRPGEIAGIMALVSLLVLVIVFVAVGLVLTGLALLIQQIF